MSEEIVFRIRYGRLELMKIVVKDCCRRNEAGSIEKKNLNVEMFQFWGIFGIYLLSRFQHIK